MLARGPNLRKSVEHFVASLNALFEIYSRLLCPSCQLQLQLYKLQLYFYLKVKNYSSPPSFCTSKLAVAISVFKYYQIIISVSSGLFATHLYRIQI